MSRKIRERFISGVTSNEEREYEIKHRAISRKAAAEGMVLLKNANSLLPLEKGSKIDLYGLGALHFVKGGTGSGDVNERDTVSIRQGMINAGFEITNSAWLDEYEHIYETDRKAWRDDILRRSKEPDSPGLFELHSGNPLPTPKGSDPVETDAKVALYVLSRVAGEGADRKNAGGDYKMSDGEHDFLKKLCNVYNDVIVVINAGGVCDLSFMDEFTGIEALIIMSQPGMEGGNALADILTGDVVPSAKLTDSWAYNYEDYPFADEYSLNGPTLDYAIYSEGIYVGYRYFDSFHKGVRYGFGFGLSYTTFERKTESIILTGKQTTNPEITVKVAVTNTGDKYTGREVVQVYASCPDGKIEKEYRRLVGFAKTDDLAPGETQVLSITFPLYSLTSYDVTKPAYVLEEGYYGIWVGNSLGDSSIRGMLRLDNEIVMVKTNHICPTEKDFDELSVPAAKRESRYRSWVEKAKSKEYTIITVSESDVVPTSIEYEVNSTKLDPDAEAFVENLELNDLIRLATADPGRAQDIGIEGFVGAGGLSIPGTAAETSICVKDKGLASMVLSDGPAGLRVDREYRMSADGVIHQKKFMDMVENGLFREEEEVFEPGDKVYYQYCTAFPVGTALAQSWNTELINEVGAAVGEEMMEFQTSLWLAPGMNIHRNPLCGRNFEYYSEDPVFSGIIAAAMTNGVQSVGGCGTTIKHFACNNQEENRFHCDSIIKERALREIYLKGFEICVKSSQPMAIMTSYNLVNGVHTANSYDLCSKVARDEWGFEGMIMTDWCTTEQHDNCSASGCMRAGNDLVCPGNITDHQNLRQELIDGTLNISDIKSCVARSVKLTWQTNAYEDAVSYTKQFDNLQEFIKVTKEK